jgi:riboflavin kinase/FMN adenylyltransferase
MRPETAGGRPAVWDGVAAFVPRSAILPWLCQVEGIVQVGAQRGRLLGFPTANLHVSADVPPSDGVYAGWAGIDSERPARPAMIYLGSAPTFGPADRRLEVHLFDFSGDLYGRRLHVAFGVRVADEHAHQSAATLAASIRRVARATREVLGC